MVVAILDLHGSLHENAASEVDNFFASNDPPFEIITGNSVKMQEIVRKVLNRTLTHSPSFSYGV